MPQVLLGAESVLNDARARQCVAGRAQFLVAPVFNAPAVAAARDRDLLIMVGALTPSEIMAASAAGADFVKVFPCGNMGGPKYLQALRGPFPQIPFVPTGGGNLENAADYGRARASPLLRGAGIV